jgi:hypothetical protein
MPMGELTGEPSYPSSYSKDKSREKSSVRLFLFSILIRGIYKFLKVICNEKQGGRDFAAGVDQSL